MLDLHLRPLGISSEIVCHHVYDCSLTFAVSSLSKILYSFKHEDEPVECKESRSQESYQTEEDKRALAVCWPFGSAFCPHRSHAIGTIMKWQFCKVRQFLFDSSL